MREKWPKAKLRDKLRHKLRETGEVQLHIPAYTPVTGCSIGTFRPVIRLLLTWDWNIFIITVTRVAEVLKMDRILPTREINTASEKIISETV